MTTRRSADLQHRLRVAALLTGAAIALGACTHTNDDVTASIPDDYRLRHPIAIQESNQTVDVFVGNARGGLSAPQRADVVTLTRSWMHEGTGPITIDVPVQTRNARAAADSVHEIRSLLAAGGVPANGVIVRDFSPADPQLFAPIRVSYPRIKAVVGPCGVWPEDLGPSIKDKSYLHNKPYWNLGCASQHNLAAMIDNPADLVQPRAETPPYTLRRSEAFEKYRKGTATTTKFPEADTAKLSDVGK